MDEVAGRRLGVGERGEERPAAPRRAEPSRAEQSRTEQLQHKED